MTPRHLVAWLACALLIVACSPESATVTSVALDVVTFVELDAVLIDGETVSAILAGAAPRPDYNSNPPTSGARAADFARCGIYRQPIPDLYQVASLAQGSVIVHYRGIFTADARDRVEQAARDIGQGVIVAPNANLETPIVLTAWGTMLAMSFVDKARIAAFVDQYGGRGPSPQECPATVDDA